MKGEKGKKNTIETGHSAECKLYMTRWETGRLISKQMQKTWPEMMVFTVSEITKKIRWGTQIDNESKNFFLMG